MDKLCRNHFDVLNLLNIWFVLFRSGSFLLASYIMLSSQVPALAQTAVWNGNQSNDWSQSGNWNSNSVPPNGANSNVTINDSTINSTVATGLSFTGSALNIASNVGVSGVLELVGNSDFQLRAVNLGTQGSGRLTIVDSALTTTGTINIGTVGHGVLTVSGPNARLAVTGTSSHLNIGNSNNGYGRVEIREGATVEARNVSLGNLRGSGI